MGNAPAAASWAAIPAAALHKHLLLKPGQEERLIFMLGVGPRSTGRKMRKKYSSFTSSGCSFYQLEGLLAEEVGRLPVQDT